MMKNDKIVVLICDDDEINMGINQKCVEIYSKRMNINVELHCFLDENEKMDKLIESGVVDIAILDIQLKHGSGIDVAKRLQETKPKLPIIFITSFTEYKPLACDILAVGYFEKPLHPEKFEIVYERAIAQIELERNIESNQFLELCINRKNIRLRISNIYCIEKIQRKVIFKTKSGIYEVRGNIIDYVDKLDSNFLQISQSVIINTQDVILIDSSTVYLSTGDQFTIGRTFLKKVKNII